MKGICEGAEFENNIPTVLVPLPIVKNVKFVGVGNTYISIYIKIFPTSRARLYDGKNAKLT